MLYLQLTHTKPLMLLLLIHSVCLSVHVSVLSYCTTQSGEEEERRVCEKKLVHLVDKLLDQLKVLRPDALGAVDQQHQVDVAGPAG